MVTDFARIWSALITPARVEETVKIGIFNAMKYGWTLRGVDCGFCRSPFKPLSMNARAAMERLMAQPLEME